MRHSPNIVFLFSDDHAINALSAYGGPLEKLAPTPNIDRLAREGALFPNSFCANSICISEPTGFDDWEVLPGQGSYDNPDFLTPSGRVRYSGHVSEITTRLALGWLRERRDPIRPFLLMCQHMMCQHMMCQHKAPHRNWMPVPEHLRLFENVKFPEPATLTDTWANRASVLARAEMSIEKDLTWVSDLKLSSAPGGRQEGVNGELSRMTPDQRAAWNAVYGPIDREFQRALPRLTPREVLAWKFQRYLTDYLRCVRGVDDSVGRVLGALDSLGLAENTIVIYSSDQGFYLGEHGWYDKRWMFEESLKMPLVLRWPGVVRPGLRPDSLVQNIDYAPTLLQAAGLPVPKEMQGESLLPVLRGGRLAREAIYYRYTGERTHNVAAHDGVRTRHHKLMYFPATNEWNLFDLKADPQEMRSVHAEPGYASTLMRLKALRLALRRRYRAPEPF